MATFNPADAFCAAVDWGTSSFRLWVFDRNGDVLAERRSGQGMSTLEPGDFEGVLESHLGDIGVPGDVPAVICGMAGAAQGWQEAGYLDLPTSLSDVADQAIAVASSGREVRILPGLAQRDAVFPDVIRGEETLLLGAGLNNDLAGTVCLPGTHSKWVRISDGSVTEFHTAMTGEMFSLLAHKSTLSHFIGTAGSFDPEDQAFELAFREMIENPARVLNALFSVRAAPLLGTARAQQMPARLSGLLVGLEMAGMRGVIKGKLTLISDGDLAQTYARAFTLAGLEFELCASEKMVRAGLYSAARSLWLRR